MRFISAFVLVSAVFLTGCAATVSRDGPTTATSRGSSVAVKAVVLEISGAGNLGTGEDWDALLEEWQTSMTAAALSKGVQFTLAKPGVEAPSGPAVLVKMKVNDFRYVSQAKRYATGLFSGNAYLDLDVEFIEMPQLKIFATRKFKTSSSAWQGVFSAMTPKQVEAVSNEIISEITER